MSDKVAALVAGFSTILVAIVVLGLLFSLPVMWLWNYALIPAVPGLVEIGWFQAWGIMILCGLLFKSSTTVEKK